MENEISKPQNWQQVKEKIKELNIHITDEDLVLIPGNEEDLFERLAVKLNKTKQEVRDWIVSISSNKSIAG